MAVRSPAPQEGKLKSFFTQCPFASNIWFSIPHLFTVQRLSSPRPQTVRQEDGERLFKPPCLAGLMPGAQGRWLVHSGSYLPGCGSIHSAVCSLAFRYRSTFPFLPSDLHLRAFVLNSTSAPAPQHSHHSYTVSRACPNPKLHSLTPTSTFSFSRVIHAA